MMLKSRSLQTLSEVTSPTEHSSKGTEMDSLHHLAKALNHALHSVHRKQQLLQQLKDELSFSSLPATHKPLTSAITTLKLKITAEEERFEDASRETARLEQLAARITANLVTFIQTARKKQTLELEKQRNGVGKLTTQVHTVKEKAKFVEQEAKFRVDDGGSLLKVSETKRNYSLNRLRAVELTASQTVTSLTQKLASRSADQLKSRQRTVTILNNAENSIARGQLAIQRKTQADAHLHRLKQQIAALSQHAEILNDPPSEEDVKQVCETYLQLTAEHRSLTLRYMQFMEEATRLQQMQVAVESQYRVLKTEDDGTNTWAALRPDCAHAGLGSTFNQVLTKDPTAANLHTDHLEATALRCFVHITDIIKHSIRFVRAANKQSGDSNLNLAVYETGLSTLITADRPERRLRKSLTLNSRNFHKAPKRSLELAEEKEPVETIPTAFSRLIQPFFRHFTGEKERLDSAIVRKAHLKCRQQVADTGKVFTDFFEEVLRVEKKMQLVVKNMEEQAASLRPRKTNGASKVEMDTNALLRSVFSWKYDALAKAKSRRWVEIEEIVAGYRAKLTIQPLSTESDSCSDKESEDSEQSLLHSERMMMKQRSLPSVRQVATPKAKSTPTSPRQVDLQVELRHLRDRVATVKRLGEVHTERLNTAPTDMRVFV